VEEDGEREEDNITQEEKGSKREEYEKQMTKGRLFTNSFSLEANCVVGL
jgi:hypothetical protein